MTPWNTDHLRFLITDYLEKGNLSQRRALKTIEELGLYNKLKDHNPVLAGTIPIELDIPGSDLDILCQFECPHIFAEKLKCLYSDKPGFYLKEKKIRENITVIAGFKTVYFPVEIFGQKLHPTRQDAFIHMINESQILNWAGGAFKNKIIELKRRGLKTEPAFAFLFGVKSDPYTWLLKPESSAF